MGLERIKRANGISDPTDLRVGQRIYIPGSSISGRPVQKLKRSKRNQERYTQKIRLDEKLQWPLKGKVLTSFGSNPAHRYDGINIEGKYGQEVKAASDGEVMYSGNGIKGYGNMIIIKHGDKVYSIYALNSENLVSKGDRVKKSQVIAKVGGIPRIGKSFLHFQVRKGKRAINPLSVLQ